MRRRAGTIHSIWRRGLWAALFVSAVCGGPASAATVTAGNHPQANEENLLLDLGATALVVQGLTLNSFQLIDFNGVSEPLTIPATGEPRIEAADGSFTLMSILPESDRITFQDLILDIRLAGEGQRSATIFFVWRFADGSPGGATENEVVFQLGPGSNFFTVVAGPGEALTAVAFVETEGDVELQDVRHIRMSGVCIVDGECVVVAEPGALALLEGSILGLAAFAWRRRSSSRTPRT
jgi:hypothetical protein